LQSDQPGVLLAGANSELRHARTVWV